MKKFITTSIIAILFAGLWCLAGCEKEKRNKTPVQEETIVNPVTPDSSVKEKLDDFFSNWEDTVTEKYTNCIYVIDDMSDLKKLGCDDLNIDFGKYSLIWGKVMSYHTGYFINKRDLYDCGDGTYRYDVILNVRNSGYGIVYGIYFWDIYPKKNYKNLVLNVKRVYL